MTLFLFISPTKLMAGDDYTISGRIVDANRSPVSAAQIVMEPGRHTTYSDENGNFSVVGLTLGMYSLTVSHLNYKKYHLKVINVDKSINLGEIILTETVIEASGTVVTTNRKGVDELLLVEPLNIISGDVLQERVPKETPELLREETGIFVQKTNHGGGSPIIRGLNSNRLLMLVDGFRLNNATYRLGIHQYLTTIDEFALAALEVMRGPGSVLYGSDAVGGVINAVTNGPVFGAQNPWTFHLTGVTESADQSLRGNSGFAYSSSLFYAAVNLTLKKFGDLRRGSIASIPQLEKSPNGAEQKPSGYDAWSYDAKIGIQLENERTLVIAAQGNRQYDVPRYDKYENNDYYRWTYEPQWRNLLYIKYNGKIHFSGFDEIKMGVAYHFQEEGRHIQKTPDSNLEVESDAVYSGGWTTTLTGKAGSHQYAGGLDIYYDKVKSHADLYDYHDNPLKQGSRGRFPDNATYLSAGCFANDVWSVDQHFLIDGGVRFSAFRAAFTDTALYSGQKVDNTYRSLIFNLGARYTFGNGFFLRAGIRQGFRAPNLSDLAKLGQSKGSTYEIPNPDLSPEQIRTFDLGIELLKADIEGNVCLYYSHLSDIISSAPAKLNDENTILIDGSEFQVRSKQNLGQTDIYGVEAAVKYTLTRRLSFSANAAYTYGENTSLNLPADGIPPFFGRAGIRWQKDVLFYELFSRFAGKQDRLSEDDLSDPRIPPGGSPGWYTINFRLGDQFFNRLEVIAGIENILDHNYREHGSGINGPGRNFVLRLSYRFD